MNLLGIICRITKRHKWSKPSKAATEHRFKMCHRCKITREVKRREAKPRGTKFGVLS